MARLLIRALGEGGHGVAVASMFCSYDRSGDALRQLRLARLGRALAARMVRRLEARPRADRPELWFTYHLYHKAPDWLGPTIAARLGIPYVVAEASHAPKQASGPWALGHRAAADAIAGADRVIALNSADLPCLRLLAGDGDRLVRLAPFIDAAPFRTAATNRRPTPASPPRLITVAMMRPGDKLASYRILGEALGRLVDRPWRLTVVGDGPARDDVRVALAAIADRVTWLGQVAPEALPELLSTADAFLWPAVNEAYGLALLEAQAAGLPVVAGRSGGVPDVVADGESGVVVAAGDAAAFAVAVAHVLDDPAARRRLGRAAWKRVRRQHVLPVATARLGAVLEAVGGTRVPA